MSDRDCWLGAQQFYKIFVNLSTVIRLSSLIQASAPRVHHDGGCTGTMHAVHSSHILGTQQRQSAAVHTASSTAEGVQVLSEHAAGVIGVEAGLVGGHDRMLTHGHEVQVI